MADPAQVNRRRRNRRSFDSLGARPKEREGQCHVQPRLQGADPSRQDQLGSSALVESNGRPAGAPRRTND